MLTGRMTKRLPITLAATIISAVVGLLVAPVASYADPGNAALAASGATAKAAATAAETTAVGKTCRLHGTKVKNAKSVSDQDTFPSGGQWQVEGEAGTTLTLTFTTSIANSVTGTLGATYKEINATVGFSVTRTYTVAVSGSYAAPKGNGYYVLYAGYREHVTQFEVWKNWGTIDSSGQCTKAYWKKAGTEYAFKYAGIVFRHYRR